MIKPILILLVATLCVIAALWGCQPPATEAEETGDFAAGAFPPTLSDTEYHQRAWSRPTCMSCHEHELEGAPKIRHVSVPEEAKLVKCRTCHVLVPGSSPRE
jgi:cytochrome c5